MIVQSQHGLKCDIMRNAQSTQHVKTPDQLYQDVAEFGPAKPQLVPIYPGLKYSPALLRFKF